MLFISKNKRVCVFLPKLQKRYFATLKWEIMAEMNISEKSQVSGIIIFEFKVKKIYKIHWFYGRFCDPISIYISIIIYHIYSGDLKVQDWWTCYINIDQHNWRHFRLRYKKRPICWSIIKHRLGLVRVWKEKFGLGIK